MKLTGLDGRAAFVTGANGGIGLAVTQALLASGVRVFATDIATDNLNHSGGKALLSTRLDVTDSSAVDRAVGEAEEHFGGIDFGINVAGTLASGPVTEMADEDWTRVFAVNAGGVFHVSRALARVMLPRRSGSIVTVSSNAAGIPRQNMAAYAASKAAATMFTRSLGLELAPHGIRCNIVVPGSTMTAMQTSLWNGDNDASRVIEGTLSTYRTGIPLQKLATPEDIAHSVIFLLSDQAGHIAMTDIYVDGGATLRA